MRYIERDARIVWSASDLKAAAECEFAWLRAIDAKIGRIAAVEDPEDATLERAARLGTAHELRVLDEYRRRLGAAVREIPAARSSDADALAEAARLTDAALVDPSVEVVYQAAFATDEFVGFADFLVREPEVRADGTRRWIVQDTKLARRARVTALMQLAAYVDQLDRLRIPRSAEVQLLLGDGSTSTHHVDDLLPVFGLRRERLRALIVDRQVALGAAGPVIGWGDARGDLDVVACGRCATCELEVVAHRDLLLVAGMRPVQRDRLRSDGIETIDALAQADRAPAAMSGDTFASLRTQARLQLDSPAGVPADDAPAHAVPTFEVVAPASLGVLPRPDHGDLFFDFEGDPLYTEGVGEHWGIDYLFGWVDSREVYGSIWAHTFDEEHLALERFLDMVALRRQQHPDMHIYHYAPYEPTHLLTMAARYGIREADVDRLLRDGVFVDLYPVVRRALRVGSRSYSIKKLEPLYMGDEVRTSDVQRGDDSIVKYVEARALAADGDAGAAQKVLDDLADYNRYDCVSTRRLRDWLVERARESGAVPARGAEPDEKAYEPSPRATALQRWAAEAAESGSDEPVTDKSGTDSPEATALRLAAAAIDYYPREEKTYWATHFLRLREPVSVWEETRDVMVVDPARSRVTTDWHIAESGRGSERRVVELRGELAPGTRLTADAEPFAVYDLPAPFPIEVRPRWIHGARRVTVREVLDDGAVVEEIAADGVTWDELPLALTPPAPPRAGNQQKAIDAWADAVLIAAPTIPAGPAADILRRVPPRTRSGGFAPVTALSGGTPPRTFVPGLTEPSAAEPSAAEPGAEDPRAAEPRAAEPRAAEPRAGEPGAAPASAAGPGADGDDSVGGDDEITAIARSVADLDHSYLAVQGPPGTGKTYVGSHVIARLVAERGFRVGVVAQSHATIEHMLDQVIAAGVPASRVGKAPKDPSTPHTFTVLPKNGVAAFTAENAAQGFVVGGTAWDFSHEARIPRGSLDLLVIDEAGQFSLASTIAVSLAAQRLLLLGDPQQLPQVSQGTHPEPVDTSALGWIIDGAEVVPPELGYFLARTRRMHPAVAGPVSQLSYEGRLAAHPSTALRRLDGVEPGVHVVPVRHRGNSTCSVEEAEEVAHLVARLVGREWTGAEGGAGDSAVVQQPRALRAEDIIVITPYNAQQVAVEGALAVAGFADVPVGTVDRFQGKEAVVAILTLAASSGREAPRGLEFLLLRNRINVAISRAMQAAYVVYSPALLDDLPRTPEGVARLSAFARLVGAGERESEVAR
ncbi:bifunctional RecB family nuclease/DEAD/DEAH box helicase [Microbacterium sp. VKM Ac-2923]|uniref:TM0106 family RecB-like putative nuclease n=1 Tax=Microbacterium sp. VKM Ac-2923 TaxID=2929476 RepID=UPI001FB35054|nr:bifunctional RecB family nuclease/DEAD/DEAH box helicase [Microbacterium sp. VKM Ac-2923]MCJ1707766.1 TM0106 family RecB-like putative nuclease [Microbacterium sp. VKM Ac-2923]